MGLNSKLSSTAIAVACAVLSFAANAQSTWDKSVKDARNIAAIDNQGFGESINQYSGSLSFQAVDLSIPGNFAIPVSVARTYSAELSHMKSAAPDPSNPLVQSVYVPRKMLFGDWDLEIPYIGGTFSDVGWQIDSTTPQNRCSVLSSVKSNGAPATGEPVRSTIYVEGVFWHGNQLRANGKGGPMLLANLGTQKPTTGGPYHWTTKEGWFVSCIPAQAPAQGEGFLAIDPSGTKYWFDHMSTRNVGEMHEDVDLGNFKTKRYFLYLNEVQFLPSKIVDRFGNQVTFEYTSDAFAKPLAIYSNEIPQRRIDFTYTGDLITSVSDGTRTVNYTYAFDTQGTPTLTSATLPDGHAWQYEFAQTSLLGAASGFHPTDPCAQAYPATPPLSSFDCVGYPSQTASATIAITHPSGARAEYLLKTHYQVSGPGGYIWTYPLGVERKTTSGAGLSTLQWNYAFGPSLAEVQAQCRAGACPTRAWTDELAPDYQITRRMFGIVGGADRGLVLQELRGYFPSTTTTITPPSTPLTRMDRINGDPDLADDATPVQVTQVSGTPVFLQGTNYFYRIGAAVGTPPGDDTPDNAEFFTSARRVPVSQRTTWQEGATFDYRVNSWDTYDRPLGVTRSSVAAQSYSRTDTNAYEDNFTAWVIGQPKSSTNAETGLIESRTDYDPTTALPIRTYAFGKLQQTTTYDAKGSIATTADGLGHVTSFANWKRGFPQNVTNADSTTKSASVDDPGWVRWITDETGAKTCYDYDLAGRVIKVTQPSKVTAGTCDNSWTPTVISFTNGYAAGNGMPAGHWRQITTTGNARKTVVVDALWRPVVEQTVDLADPTQTTSEVARRYDADGQVMFESYPINANGQIVFTDSNLKGVAKAYDALGRPTRIVQDSELPAPLLTKIEYLSGFARKTTDAMSNVTTEFFRVYDEPSFDLPTLIDAPENLRTTIARDVFGKPKSVTRGPRS